MLCIFNSSIKLKYIMINFNNLITLYFLLVFWYNAILVLTKLAKSGYVYKIECTFISLLQNRK